MGATKEKFSGYKVAVGCMLVVLAHLGCCYLWGVMLPHFLKAFQCSTAVLAGSSSVGTIIAFLAAMSSGSVLKKFSPRTVLFFGTCVCAAFMLINAFATAPWMVYVSNGISGFIIAYGGHLTCTSIINRWFIKRRSTIIGIVVSGAVFVGSLYMFLAGQLIERVGQMNTYLILGGLSVCIALVCEIALIRSTPEELGQKPLGWNETRDESVERISADHDAESGLTAAEARRSKEFIMLLIAVFMSAMLMATFTTYATTFWMSEGLSQSTAATMASIITLLGGCASIAVGVIADRFGLKSYLTTIFASFLIGLVLTIIWGSTSVGMIALVFSIIFISMGNSIQGIYANITLPVFGKRAAPSINGNLMGVFQAGVATQSLLFGALYDAWGSFIPIFCIQIGIVIVVYSLMSIVLSMNKKKLASNK